MEKDLNNISKLKLIVTIVKRGSGCNIVKLSRTSGALFSTIMLGRGAHITGTSDYENSKEHQEEVVLCIIHESQLQTVLEILKAELELDNGRSGIAFTVPINGLVGEKALTKLVNKKLMDLTNNLSD